MMTLQTPCPFCGCREQIISEHDRDHPNDRDYRFRIECNNCEVGFPLQRSEQEAIKLWNERRTPISEDFGTVEILG